MAKGMSRYEKVQQLSMRLKKSEGEARRKRPYLYVKPTDDLLFVENVAQLLGCSIDYVRRIPRRELPAARCGARLQYLRDDVLAFVRRHRDLGQQHASDMRALRNQPPSTLPEDGYDPVADARRQLGGKPKR